MAEEFRSLPNAMQRESEDCRAIAELFTLLPSGCYEEAFLNKCFPHIIGANAQETLLQLADGGWLDSSPSGYFMHPLIAISRATASR